MEVLETLPGHPVLRLRLVVAAPLHPPHPSHVPHQVGREKNLTLLMETSTSSDGRLLFAPAVLSPGALVKQMTELKLQSDNQTNFF